MGVPLATPPVPLAMAVADIHAAAIDLAAIPADVKPTVYTAVGTPTNATVPPAVAAAVAPNTVAVPIKSCDAHQPWCITIAQGTCWPRWNSCSIPLEGRGILKHQTRDSNGGCVSE
jgi:hypothetical protein